MQLHLHVQRLVEQRGEPPNVLQVRGLGRGQGQHPVVLHQEVVVLLHIKLELLKGQLAAANAHDEGVVEQPIPQVGVFPSEMLGCGHRSYSSLASSPGPAVSPPGFSPAWIATVPRPIFLYSTFCRPTLSIIAASSSAVM